MFLYSLKRTKIDLGPALAEPHSLNLREVLTSPEAANQLHEAARIARASARFFVDPRDRGRTVPRRTPTVYRDPATGLVRCFYREILIRFKTRVPAARRRAHLADLGLERVRSAGSTHRIVVRDPRDRRQGDDLIHLANTLAERSDDIVFATPNFVSEFARTATPIIPPMQWHLENTGAFFGQTAGQDVRARPAWPISQGRGIIVAVLDDGVDLDHPALRGQIWLNPDPTAPDKHGRDYFLPSAPDFNDPSPKVFNAPFDDITRNDIHGTPCAGLVAAAAPDGRAYGVAPQATILPVKIFHAGELASHENITAAIVYAASIAPVLSCSWHTSPSPDIEDAINTAATSARGGKGCCIFCSAGDKPHADVGFPASASNAIAIGASTDEGLPADYSSPGPKIAMAAPSHGGDRAIFTCNVSGLGTGFNPGQDHLGGADGLYTNNFGGTSAAVPIVAGAAAVLLSHRPNLTQKQIVAVLQQTADRIPSDADGPTEHVGAGKINLFAALNSL